jgi:hypothetical protein
VAAIYRWLLLQLTAAGVPLQLTAAGDYYYTGGCYIQVVLLLHMGDIQRSYCYEYIATAVWR